MEQAKKNWKDGKLVIKGLIIGVITLLLLIPALFVQGLIEERMNRKEAIEEELGEKWAGNQTITGPVLLVPYKIHSNKDSVKKEEIRTFQLLPSSLAYNGEVLPEKRSRSLFEIMLYSSSLQVNGHFDLSAIQTLKIPEEDILWNEAFVRMNLSDVKGLNEQLKLNWNGQPLLLSPENAFDRSPYAKGFYAPVAITAGEKISFTGQLKFKGSKNLSFIPLGNETTVQLTSTWPDPSFTGNSFADHHITAQGFTANWKVLGHTLPYPGMWKDDKAFNIEQHKFGVDIYVAVSSYSKTLRSVKYAILTIILCFASFFILESMYKKPVHPFQYALIGIALILFYTLLLSFSEYIGFDMAYCVATTATVLLIGWFAKGIFGAVRPAIVMGVVITLLYTYVFTILQLQDFALLMGSIGLFITLAIIMRFSRKLVY